MTIREMDQIIRINSKKLISNIDSLSVGDDTFWSFKGRSTRHHCHALFQYPAMMVPQMQGTLIDSILEINPNIQTVYDPFVGVGTTLGECMTRGLNFVGQDINPLAILACRVKSGPLFVNALEHKIQRLISAIKQDNNETIEVKFFGIDKWFLPSVQIGLSKIRRAIQQEESKWARRIFWLTMSSTIRTACNSRSSTYKLHIKELDKIRSICPIEHFTNELTKNFNNLKATKQLLKEQLLLNSYNQSHYSGEIVVTTCDVRTAIPKKNQQFDLLISSPPYGDNQTTVPYGQFSYLPLQWIDINDIEPEIDSNLLQNQNTIDSSSLGGSLKDAQKKRLMLESISPTFAICADQIERVNPQNIKKLASFIFDLNSAMTCIIPRLKINAYMVWTLGNRRISNIEVPLDAILRELLENLSCSFVHQLERTIPSKRMAARNKTAMTMGMESVLIMQRME